MGVGSERLFDVSRDLGDDRARCGYQLLSAAGGVDALGAVVVGVGDALEVTALFEVVDQGCMSVSSAEQREAVDISWRPVGNVLPTSSSYRV